MYQSFKVVSCTPAGRKRYVELLSRYLLAQRHLIDRHIWWMNTEVAEDVEYLQSLERDYPDFFQCLYLPPGQVQSAYYSVHKFFPLCSTDEDTVYIRFDDDIVWMAPDAVERLLAFRIDHPEFFLVYPGIVNNAICTHIFQRRTAIDMSHGFAPYTSFGPAWEQGEFAEDTHRTFLKALEAGDIHRFQFGEWVFTEYERVSINCICWFGRDFRIFNGTVGVEDEQILSCDVTRILSRFNAMCGDALVSHFAFGPQREHMDRTDILEKYAVFAPEIVAP